MPPMTEADHVIDKWTLAHSGRTRYAGQSPREDETILAEVMRLRGLAATLAGKLAKTTKHRDRYAAKCDRLTAALEESEEANRILTNRGLEVEAELEEAKDALDRIQAGEHLDKQTPRAALGSRSETSRL